MSNESDWIQGVKRWCLSGLGSTLSTKIASELDDADLALGYEAAHPALFVSQWSVPAATGFDSTAD